MDGEAMSDVFNKDAIVVVHGPRWPTDEEVLARQERRRDRLRARYERRYGVPLPREADVRRALRRWAEGRIREYRL